MIYKEVPQAVIILIRDDLTKDCRLLERFSFRDSALSAVKIQLETALRMLASLEEDYWYNDEGR